MSFTSCVGIKLYSFEVANSKCEKLLDVTFNRNLIFDDHIPDICEKAGWEISALSRLILYMGINNNKRILMNAFLNSEFNYCFLV